MKIPEYFETENLIDFIENATLPVHLVSGSGIILWANKAELDLLGYSEEEYIGKHVGKFHVDPDVISDILSRLINKEPLNNYEACLQCKNGNVKVVLINSSVYWQNDNFTHTRCFTTDIAALKREDERKASRIKRQEEQLRQIDERFNKMVAEVVDYAIILLDTDGTILNWNKGAERLKGYKEKDIIGQNFRLFYLPQDRQALLPEKLLSEAAEKGRTEHEGYRVRIDGTTFLGKVIITALHDKEGNVIGFTKVTRDFSDQSTK